VDAFECRLGGWQAARVVGIAYHSLDYWVRSGLLSCEVPARGRGSRRVFSFLDLIRARAVADLRRQGVSLQTVRRILQELTEKWQVDDPLVHTGRLVVAGDDLLWVLDDQALLNAITGQLAAQALVILPVGEMVAEIRASVEAFGAA